MHYRFVGCEARQEKRNAHKNQTILQQATSHKHCDEPLFKFGVPTRRAKAKPVAMQVRYIGGQEMDSRSTGMLSPTGPPGEQGSVRMNVAVGLPSYVTSRARYCSEYMGPTPTRFRQPFTESSLL